MCELVPLTNRVCRREDSRSSFPDCWWRAIPAIVGIAVPLFIVAMASQNVPGIAAIRASGFSVPVSPTIGWIGVTNVALAPFGAFALNLAAITAAICMGREAHENPERRYVAAVAAGVFYLVVGLFGATVAALFTALPRELIVAIVGMALLVTASGLSILSIGSAFWGLVAGGVTLLVWKRG
jgi:benzoate membrane transport protein